MEEVVETLDIMADKKLMRAIKEGEEDVRKGRVRDYNEFAVELSLRQKGRRGKSGAGTRS